MLEASDSQEYEKAKKAYDKNPISYSLTEVRNKLKIK